MLFVEYAEAMHDIARGISDQIVDLDAEHKVRIPTQAGSNFAINREQGRWAEATLARGLRKAVGDEYDVAQYGESGTKIAGESGFREFYTKYRDELRTIGKRPDVLITHKGTLPSNDISAMDRKTQDLYVKHAVAGIEVRSSSYLKRAYDRMHEGDVGKFLSFTPKSEDIRAVLRWIEVYGVRHFYAQVFFDEVYPISFEKILMIISRGQERGVFRVAKNPKSQMKTTFHINVDQGLKIGVVAAMPEHRSKVFETNHGRMIHSVEFSNGTIELDLDPVRRILSGTTETR